MTGYVRIHRSLLGHPAFRNDAEAMAFAWLVAKAAWRPANVRYKGRDYKFQRGELSVSVRDLAGHMDRSKAWAERLLERLVKHGMITKKAGTQVGTQVGTHGGTVGGTPPTVITICNYDQFQPSGATDGTLNGTAVGTKAGHERDTEQRREERKKKDSPLNPPIESNPPPPFAVPQPAWRNYVDFRNKVRKPLTPHAVKLALAKLDALQRQGHDPTAVINQSIFNGWIGLFPIQGDDNGKRSGGKKSAWAI